MTVGSNLLGRKALSHVALHVFEVLLFFAAPRWTIRLQVPYVVHRVGMFVPVHVEAIGLSAKVSVSGLALAFGFELHRSF